MDLTSLFKLADSSFTSAAKYMNPIVIFSVILLAGIMLGGIVNSILRRAFSELHLDERLSSIFKAKRNYSRATRHTVVRSIYLATVILALQYAGVLLYAIYLLCALVLILILVKLFEKMMVMIPNMRARPVIRTKVHQGETLTLFTQHGSVSGVVEYIGFFHSAIRGENGDLILVPNITFAKSRLVKQKQ